MLKNFLLILLVLFSIACHQEPSYTDLNGNSIRFSDFHNKLIIINYWAPWCKPCHDEVPELNAFNKTHAQQVVILGVSYDQAPVNKIKEWVKNLGIEFTVLTSDPAKQLGVDTIPGLPTSIILDQQGHVKKFLYGPQTQKSLNALLTNW